MSEIISESLQEQIKRIFVFIKRAIDNSNKDTWVGIHKKEKGIWQHCAHMIESLDFYFCDHTVKNYEWNNEFGIDWEDFGNKNAPGPAQMTEYATKIQTRIMDRLSTMSNDEILSKEEKAPWTGSTFLCKAIYSIRHTTHHIGEINQIYNRHNLGIVKQDR